MRSLLSEALRIRRASLSNDKRSCTQAIASFNNVLNQLRKEEVKRCLEAVSSLEVKY